MENRRIAPLRHWFRQVASRILRLLVPIAAVAALVPMAAAVRVSTRVRRWRGRQPRIVWGPEPIINIKYWSQALTRRGYESTTLVYTTYAINQRADFDRHRDQFLPGGRLADRLRDYAIFAWVLRHGDVVITFFDGGFLRSTPLRGLEFRLLSWAGKKLVVSPYGSDVAVPGYLDVAEEALLRDYPQFVERADAVRDRVDHFCRWADVVVRNYQYGYLPRADVVWPTQLAFDVCAMESQGEANPHDGHNGTVVVVHAPNHRHIKGTDALLHAVQELRAENVDLSLDLLERRPNDEVLRAVLAADIVADQFIAGYAMFAIEGLAAGKPVLSALHWMSPEVRQSEGLRNCPIVDTDLESLKENMRRLVEDPDLREQLGDAGRRFAVERHSYEAVGRCWEAILDHAWRGVPLPPELPPPSQPSGSGVPPASAAAVS